MLLLCGMKELPFSFIHAAAQEMALFKYTEDVCPLRDDCPDIMAGADVWLFIRAITAAQSRCFCCLVLL